MANKYEGSIGDMRVPDILDILKAKWMLSLLRRGSTYLNSHMMYVIQQSPSNALKSILGELRPKPSGLVVEVEDTSAHAGGIVSKRARQKIGQPSYINLDTLVWIPVADPSMIWVGTKTVHRDDTYTPLVSKKAEDRAWGLLTRQQSSSTHLHPARRKLDIIPMAVKAVSALST